MARRLAFWSLLGSFLVVCLLEVTPLGTAEEELATPAVVEKADSKSDTKDADYYEMFEVLADTIDQIDQNYVEKIDRRELMEAAIEGMLRKLDPHSSYIEPDEVDQFRASVESQFGGVGITVTVRDGQLRVVSPLVGTPAYKAGVLAGDHIVEIEGKSAEGITLDDAVRRLKGKVGTKVSMTLLHAGSDEPETVELRRATVHLETVLGNRRKKDNTWDFMLQNEEGIGYIRVDSFSSETAGDVRRALEELKAKDLKGLVLDLRFNPGGLLTSAVEICDLFVDEGRIVSTEGRNVRSRVWDAKRDGTFSEFPMAVLINQYSASASEIVSACLQDHKRAVVVGERSWGKGSVQNVIELEHGRSVLKLTTASYKRPNGKNIHRFPDAKESDEWGVVPNESFRVKLQASEMRALVMDQRDRNIVLGRGVSEEDRGLNNSKIRSSSDRQLQRSLKYLKQQLEAAEKA